MKRRRMILTTLALCCMLSLVAASAHAAAAWYTCTVVQGGPGWGSAYIKLSDEGGAFTDKWFTPRSDLRREMLAGAFTAMSNGATVYVSTDINAGTYPTLNAMYVNP